MTVTNQDILKLALSEKGKPYGWGAKGPGEFDCSGLASFVCRTLGTFPTMPDGAINQYLFCKAQHTLILIDDAKKTPGALLFRISESLGDHVALSLGNSDMDVEARGAAYGVGSWSLDNRIWTNAAKIPGVVYTE